MQRLQSMIQEAQQAGARPASGLQPGQPFRRVLTQPGQSTSVGAGVESAVEGKVIMTADERTNKIFILTRVSNFDFFDQIIAELDAKVEPDVVMKVIDLDYANAEDIASLLNSLITGSAPTSTRRTSNTGTTSTGARAPAIPPPPVAVSSAAGSALEASGFLAVRSGRSHHSRYAREFNPGHGDQGRPGPHRKSHQERGYAGGPGAHRSRHCGGSTRRNAGYRRGGVQATI